MKITNQQILPNPKKLYETVIPALGHNQNEAFSDLIDNCIDADAKEIKVQIFSSDGGKIIKYRIIDNGCGMDMEQLIKSYQFANASEHETGSMGKYGVGGTLGAFTLGFRKKVYTKTYDGPLYVSYQDLEEEFGVHIQDFLSKEEEKEFSEICGEHGTIIEISKLREQGITRAGDFKNSLIKEVSEIFRNFLDIRKIFIEVVDKNNNKNSTAVIPFDPIYWNTDSVLHQEEKKYEIDNHEFSLRFVQLNSSKLSKEELKYGLQGFYFIRNNRQVWNSSHVKDLWVENPTYNYQRIEVRFHEELDAQFGLTATKNRISLSQNIKDKIREDVQYFKNTYKYKPSTSTTVQKELQEDLNKFSERLQKNASAIGAPKSKKETENTKKSSPKNNTGAVLPKNTDITRKPPQAPKRVIPKFEIVSFSGSEEAVTYGVGNDGITVYINQESSFIKQNFIGASSEAQLLLKTHWASVALTLYDSFEEGEREFSICKNYTDKVTKMMTEIHKFVN